MIDYEGFKRLRSRLDAIRAEDKIKASCLFLMVNWLLVTRSASRTKEEALVDDITAIATAAAISEITDFQYGIKSLLTEAKELLHAAEHD